MSLFFFLQCWKWNPGLGTYWASILSLSYIPNPCFFEIKSYCLAQISLRFEILLPQLITPWSVSYYYDYCLTDEENWISKQTTNFSDTTTPIQYRARIRTQEIEHDCLCSVSPLWTAVFMKIFSWFSNFCDTRGKLHEHKDCLKSVIIFLFST
jgi:hypothetical protein